MNSYLNYLIPEFLGVQRNAYTFGEGKGLLGGTVSTIHSSQFKAQYLATLQQHHVSKFMKFAFKNLRWHVTCMTSRIFFLVE